MSSPVHSAGTRRHPAGLYVLFLTEMWERFGFFGMKVLLALYLTKHFMLADAPAYAIYGAYTAMVFVAPVVGGRIADTLLGARRAVILGAVLMATGQFVLVMETLSTLFFGMGLIIVGNGFVKPNTSGLVGKLYRDGDPRRDSGFTIFYMGINLGAVVAAVACAWIGETFGYRYGFLLAGIGMVLGLLTFVWGERLLAGLGGPPDRRRLDQPIWLGFTRFHVVMLASVAAAAAVSVLVRHKPLVDALLVVVAIYVIGSLLRVAARGGRVLRDRILVLLVLMVFNVAFWACFEQAGSSLTLFADRNVDRELLGLEIPAASFQSINPAAIIVLGTLLSWAWIRLDRAGKNPSIPTKFALGLLQLALGYGVLVVGIAVAGDDARTPMTFLILLYLLHTTGELFLSPIGLSFVTKVAPKDMVGMVMGAWFLSFAAASSAAAGIAGLTGDAGRGADGGSAHASLAVYGDVYRDVGLAAAALGVLLLVLAPALQRRLHGIR